ncbi:hypothetical protein HT576_08890 [Haloterrigena sp. SYSU A121-1]|uniref:Uncharacterized protein n=1 Tax=Haloterrigena gelatinilytica TaxID=2741724 RepID=A0A8J8KF20_9EURY|nr:hypothetical protein [Haloterrigena gelatinilytica]NUB91136.1 hypothetical protein [Haloterrigena gelatinilytica]
MDNAMIAVGLKRASDVVHERASEAVVAAEANNTAAAERAASEASRMAQVAHGVNGDGLESAETLLREVRDRVPEDAHDGLDTAINEVMKAKERLPTDLPENPDIPNRSDTGAPRSAPGGR